MTATIFNFLLLELKEKAYVPVSTRSSDNCIIGIYHSLTLEKYKERVVKSFKGDGKKRVVIASTALCMAINFPDVRYIIHWGPPRNLLDYHQQSGRAGRDGKPANIIIVYYGQQTSFCEQNVKDFVN
jgi:ATP-dependent DNA helicase RecQ